MSTTTADGRMSLVDHLTELRRRLIISASAVAVGAVVCWIFYPDILRWLVEPYCDVSGATLDDEIGQTADRTATCELNIFDPLEGFSIRMLVAGYGGIALAVPIWLWQLWQFISPGLYPHERRYGMSFVFAGVVLFVLGAGLAYWSLPRALEFLIEIGGTDLVTTFRADAYVKFVVKMMLAFAVGFEFPLVLIFLQLLGVLEYESLKSGRRFALVGIVILVAVITPSGDPFTLMVLSVPMYLFYEASILFGVLRKRKQRRSKKKA